MTEPHLVLGVAAGADEATLRRRYLELVRENPPEQFPQRFAEIRAAYDQLRDPAERLKRQLFEMRTSETLDDVIADLRLRLQGTRIPTKTLFSLAGN